MSVKLPEYRVTAIIAGTTLPWNYNELVQGWIYDHLLKTPLGREVHSARYSLFNYSIIPLAPAADEKGCSSTVGCWMLRVASANQQLLDLIEENLNKESNFTLNHIKMQVVQTLREHLSDFPIMSAQPILIFGNDDKFITPAHENFNPSVAICLRNRWEYLFGTTMPPAEFSFVEKPKQKLIQYKGRNLLAFCGQARLNTKPIVLQFAQCVGLGRKPSCGFGMVM